MGDDGVPGDEEEVLTPVFVSAAPHLGERPAGLEYLVSQADDGPEQPGRLLGTVIRVLK